MNESWINELRNDIAAEASRAEASADFKARLRADLADEWHGRPVTDRTVDASVATVRRPRWGWLFAAAAATVALVGGVVVGTRQDDVVVTPPPATQPVVPTTPDADVGPPPTGVLTTTPVPTVTDSTAPATSIGPSEGVVTVPLDPATPVPVEPFATVEYGAGPDQIEILNGEFPPPAVQYIAGVLVLEDAPETGLTGRAVIVEGGSGDITQQVTFNDLEPGGTPLAVRSFDGGGVVIVTVHDETPRVRIRRYTQNPPGEFNQFGDGVDSEALGDSQLRITSEGATWGGELVIPSDPSVARPAVDAGSSARSDSVLYIVTRPVGEGTTAAKWTFDVEIDAEFPPSASSPLVEPFGDGVLFSVRNSSARGAQAPLVLLRSDFTADIYDLDGWALADVRPDQALLTRSTPDGLELGLLRPEAIASETPSPDQVADWPAPSTEPGDLEAVPRLLPAEIEGVTEALRNEGASSPIDIYDYTQSWIAADGSGYIEIVTKIDQADFTPAASRTPVDIGGWDDAYSIRSVPPYANLLLVTNGSVVRMNSLGLGEERTIEIARSMTRRPAGEPGWDIDDVGLIEFHEGGDQAAASRFVRFEGGGTLIAQLWISAGPLYGAPINWSPESTVQLIDIDGRPAVAADNGFATAVSWTLGDGTAVQFGYSGPIDQAIELARTIAPVDQSTWEVRTIQDPNLGDGCNSLFC